MTLEQRELYRFLTGFYKFLDQGHKMELKKLRLYSGLAYYHEGTKTALIKLDYRDDIISTLIHEYIHIWRDDWSEEKVLKFEKAVINRLSNRQVKNVIKRFANTL